MRLALYVSSLSCGGSERVMSIMANYWAARGWEITLFTLDDPQVVPFFELHPQVRHVPLGLRKNSYNVITTAINTFRRIRAIRRSILKLQPQAIISFIDKMNILTLLATLGLKIPVVVSERIDLNWHKIGKIPTLLRWILYSRACKIVVQTQGACNYFLPKFQDRTCIIPNPVLVPPKDELSHSEVFTKPYLLAMGRLSPQKRHDLLIRTFSKIKDKHPEWTLIIMGEGPLRPSLECLCKQLDLTQRVKFAGNVKESYTALRQAEIFVMSSSYEGFPNSLCEAMACGLPVISTDCPSGPREIIRDNIDGILVPPGDEEALATAMDRLLSNKAERDRLGKHATEIIERFKLTTIMEMWERILSSCTKTNQGDHA